MKKKIFLLVAILVLISLRNKSQISIENTYTTTTNSYNSFYCVKLASSGYKYVDASNLTAGSIKLYNLNHTLFKTLTFTPPAGAIKHYYVSETLFNTNASDVEFMIIQPGPPTNVLYIYNETGTVLFSIDSIIFAGNQVMTQIPLLFTTAGVKLMLASGSNQVYIVALPGSLPCSDCTNGVISSIPVLSGGNDPVNLAFPNPAANEIKIVYNLPTDTPAAEITFYTLDGKELRSFGIDHHNDFIMMDKTTLGASSGTYIYKIHSNTKVISTDKIIFE